MFITLYNLGRNNTDFSTKFDFVTVIDRLSNPQVKLFTYFSKHLKAEYERVIVLLHIYTALIMMIMK